MKNYTLLAFWLCITLCYMHDIQPSGYEYQSMLCDPLVYTKVDMSKFDGSPRSISLQGEEIDKFVFQYTCAKFIKAIKDKRKPEDLIELLSVMEVFDLALYPAHINHATLFYENHDQLGQKYMQGGFIQALCNGEYTKTLPLHYAVYSHGDIDSINILLEHGADPNKIDDNNHTALNYAKNQLTMRLLLQHDAKPTTPRSIKRLIQLQILPRINKAELVYTAFSCLKKPQVRLFGLVARGIRDHREIHRLITLQVLPRIDQKQLIMIKSQLKIRQYNDYNDNNNYDDICTIS